MKHHLMIAFGLLMVAVFFAQAIDALSQPGVGFREAYVIGGFLLAGALVKTGLAERKRARSVQ